MKVKDFNSYRAPSRKPWGVLVILFVLGVLAYVFFIREPSQPSDEQVTSDVAEVEADVDRDAAAESLPGVEDGVMVAPAASVALLMDEAAQLAADERLVDARLKYLTALKHAAEPSVQRQIERKLAPINIELVMTPRQMPEKLDCLVKSGDSLDRIARRYKTTTELIQKSNQLLNPNIIKAGDRLRVFTGQFNMVASKSKHELVVMMNGEFFKRYQVGTGRFGKTPVGSFVIRDKIKEPVWWRPDGREIPFGDKENVLGTRWLAMRATGETEDVRGYGIHGTWEPESVGSASSAGCLRMLNDEVEELFVYIPLGTPIVVEK